MGERDRDEPLGWFDPQGAATFRAAWDDSPAVIAVTVGRENVLVYQNKASRELFGARRLDAPLAEVFPEIGAAGEEPLERVRSAGEVAVFRRRTVGVRDVRGREVVLSYTLSPLGRGVPAEGVIIRAVNVTGEVRAEEAADRARLLADITTSVATAVDTTAGLQAFVDSLVPVLADLAAFYVGTAGEDLVDTADPVPPAVIAFGHAVAAAGPPPPPVARDEPSPWQEVLQAGQPIVIPIDDESFPVVAPDPAAAQWLTTAGATSIAVMPMVVAGQMTGALLLLTAADRPPYREADLPFLVDVAGRAGAAMAQQHTQRRQRDIASRLQHALLPPEPTDLPGLSIAARYVAGAPDVDVGGDWWHVQDLGEGRVAVGIGDVSGRGVAAAAVMGQARAAMGAAAHARLAPADVLTVLDAQLAALMIPDLVAEPAPPRFATACYGVVDAAADLLRIANAGHPPLLLRSADGDVRVVDLPPGAPLGLLAGRFTAVDVPFRPGDTIAMFTDGLVESRELDLDDGLAALADAFGRFGAEPDLAAVIKQVLDAMSVQPGYGADDMALLLVRRDDDAPG